MFINMLLILAVIIMTAFVMLKSIQKKQNAEIDEKIDVDENPLAANLYHVSSIPTIKIFKDGELKDSKVGFQPKEFLKEAIEELI